MTRKTFHEKIGYISEELIGFIYFIDYLEHRIKIYESFNSNEGSNRCLLFSSSNLSAVIGDN